MRGKKWRRARARTIRYLSKHLNSMKIPSIKTARTIRYLSKLLNSMKILSMKTARMIRYLSKLLNSITMKTARTIRSFSTVWRYCPWKQWGWSDIYQSFSTVWRYHPWKQRGRYNIFRSISAVRNGICGAVCTGCRKYEHIDKDDFGLNKLMAQTSQPQRFGPAVTEEELLDSWCYTKNNKTYNGLGCHFVEGVD